MAHRYVDLEEDTPCPYCRTVVPAGGCVCPSCGAAHMSVYRGLWTAVIFFVVGWMLGAEGGMSPLLIGAIVAVAGSLLAKMHADRNPKWVRGTW